MLYLLYEADWSAALSASEAVADILGGAYRQRRGAVLMERAQPLIAGAFLLEIHIVADNVDDVKLLQFLNVSVFDHSY
jgi:hypothetical protein